MTFFEVTAGYWKPLRSMCIGLIVPSVLSYFKGTDKINSFVLPTYWQLSVNMIKFKISTMLRESQYLDNNTIICNQSRKVSVSYSLLNYNALTYIMPFKD